MFNIIVEKECGCFKRSDLQNNVQMGTKEDALSQAIQMKDTMNTQFCGKHDFVLSEQSNNFVIEFAQQEQSGGSCGSACGCGSN